MAEYETRKIRGWRGLLDDAITEVRDRFWSAPADTIYFAGVKAQTSDNLANHVRWFRRIFGPDRVQASSDLKALQRANRKSQWAERTPERKQEQYEKRIARRAAHTQIEREHERAMCREWRARQGSDWRTAEAAKKRLRRLAKPELYREIDRRSSERNKKARNARARAYYAVHRDRLNEATRARRAKQKAQLDPMS